nr:PP0621 family protein [uncultured Campylobacter sp.]
MLFKILAFLAVLIAIYVLFFKNRIKNGTKKDDGEAENFVECAKCGTFVEAKQSVLSSGKYVCKECMKEKK